MPPGAAALQPSRRPGQVADDRGDHGTSSIPGTKPRSNKAPPKLCSSCGHDLRRHDEDDWVKELEQAYGVKL